MFDGILNATLSEKVSTTGVTQENLELPLPPNELPPTRVNTNQHESNTSQYKSKTGPR